MRKWIAFCNGYASLVFFSFLITGLSNVYEQGKRFPLWFWLMGGAMFVLNVTVMITLFKEYRRMKREIKK
ncbi:MAG: hypothetical protein ACRC5T_11930 [Cetobacterium sp.]